MAMQRSFRSGAAGVAFLTVGALAGGCGPSPIHVNGVLRESTEMRPLRNLPTGSYAQIRVLVRSAEQSGPDCAATPLEGSENHNNAACIPAEASNAAVRLVRQRLRSYGMGLAHDAKEPYDYEVSVLVSGVAPKQPDPMSVKAMAKLTFRHGQDAGPGGFFAAVDAKAAGAAFDAVARDCALRDAALSEFSAMSVQPMTPELDINALASDAVDNAVGCDELGRFFLDARTRFPPGPAPGAAPAPGAPASTSAPPPTPRGG
jgi:hypothetical protein